MLENSLGSEVVADYRNLHDDISDEEDEAPDPNDRDDPFDTDETSEDDDLMPERLIENKNPKMSEREVSDLIKQELDYQDKQNTDLINQELARSGGDKLSEAQDKDDRDHTQADSEDNFDDYRTQLDIE